MVFSSLSFLFCFFPAFLLVYYLTPSRPAGARNAVLLVGSCVFYIIGLDGQWAYFALLAASVLVNYGLGLAITRDKPRAKLWLIVGLCYNFLWLFLFKYLNFLLTGVNGVLGWVSGGKAAVPLLGWALPVGISFYTFSAGGYLIDVYRGTVAPERSLLTFGTYLTMFPKLVSGPIASYAQLQPEFGARDVSLRQTVDGLKLFVFGMALKILLANQLGGLWSDVTTIGFESLSTPLAWMAAFAYSFQLYFDFWGYSLMAIGIGRMLGFHLPENFRCPYLALTMTEFWRRWHISLSTWLRDYLYISLGGNRKGRIRTYFNLLVTMLLGGLWHGAAVRFILWGALHGIALALHKLWLSVVPGSKATGAEMRWFWRIPGIFFTFNLVCFGWLMFRAESMKTVQLMLHQIFTNFNPSVIPQVLEGYAGIFLLVGIGYLLHMLPDRCDRWAQRFVTSLPTVVQVLLAACVIWLVMQVKSSDIQPFIYFQF